MDQLNSEMERIFAAKARRRRELAALPFHEKVRIVVQMQEMVAPILRARGINVEPWKLPVSESKD